MKTFVLALACCMAVTTEAVLVKSKEFQRFVPRDKLRDFPNACFASTKCRVYEEDESWSLKPFCGFSTCYPLNHTLKNGTVVQVLTERVTDCGPLIDLERTPTCTPITLTEAETEAEFPDCCPKYDCEEGTQIVYEGQPAPEPKSLN